MPCSLSPRFVRLFSNPTNRLNGVQRLNGWNGLQYLEKKYAAQFKLVFAAIWELVTPPTSKRRKIGFLVEEVTATYGRR